MKLKCRPEDFRVEELPVVTGDGPGRYTFYRLEKRGLGTIEAVELICRRWNVPSARISYGGLKDRHACTTQYLTIVDGQVRELNAPNLDLVPVGRLAHPYRPAHFRGNRFELVLRDMSSDELARAVVAISSARADGLPNYFDDQRFGSVGYSGDFIGQAWLVGDHERALKLALAEPNPFDRSGAKAEKAILREFWGRWSEAKSRLPRSSARSIVTYLVDHPVDFRGAFARMRRELRTLYFSAFQSHLWNLILAQWIERSTRPDQRAAVDLKAGTFPFPIGLEPDQAKLLASQPVPLPSSRTPPPDGPLGQAIVEVLNRHGLTWTDLRVKHLKDVFFSKGTRPAMMVADGLTFSHAKDEMHPGRAALRLSFELGKGSYATILVKRITEAAAAGT